MRARVIQGFFAGGARPVPATVPTPRGTVQRVAVADTRPGPPPSAFVGRTMLVQQRPAPGRPPLVHASADSQVAQRFGGDGSFAVDPVQVGLAPSGGIPLPKPVLAKMEAAFDADFSAVRVHVGPQASRIGAIAFTTGNDLYFAPGQFQPDSAKGQQLIGHELAHVIQQRAGRVRAPGSGVAVVQDRMLEAEADRLGMRAASIRQPVQAKSGRSDGPRPRPADRRVRRAAPLQPMMSYLSGLTATDLPQGVEHRRDVGGGFRVGYHAPKGQIGLYDNKATLVAHVNIQTYPSEGLIVLHTGTDQGKIGGQGYLGMFFGEALRIIKRDFFYGYQTIQMTPALGAATKGLISQLARIRLNVIGGHGNKFSTARVFMAKDFLKKAAMLREQRKKTGGEKPSAQSWHSASMLETAWELNAIAEMERASPTGLQVRGMNAVFNDFLVGPDAPPLPGGALAWHKAGDEHDQAMLNLEIPIAAIDSYIAALPN